MNVNDVKNISSIMEQILVEPHAQGVDSQHTIMVAKLAKMPHIIQQEMSILDYDLMHMTMGICGEAGELLDAIKKKIIYQKPLDKENIIEELGDLEFYMKGLRASLSITREECLVTNMKKLSIRYGEQYQYTNKQAIQRKDKNNA